MSSSLPSLRTALILALGAVAPASFAQLTLSSSESGSGYSNAIGSNYTINNSSDPDVVRWGTQTSDLGRNLLAVDRVNGNFNLNYTTGAAVKVATLDYTNTHTTGDVITAIDYTLRLNIPSFSQVLDFKFTLSIDTTLDPNASGPQTPDRIKWESLNNTQIVNLGGTNYVFNFGFNDTNGSFLETENTWYSVNESYYSNNKGGYSWDCGGDYQTATWGKDSADIWVSVVKPTTIPNNGVPEPSTYGLLGACAILALITARRALRK